MDKYINAEKLNDWLEIVPLTDDGGVDINELEDWIKNAVMEDVAPVVHAHWIQTEIIDDDDPTGINDKAAKCSNCEHIEGWFYWAKTYYHFCPNCGAQMEGRGDNETD